jgi:hypothetical protein
MPDQPDTIETTWAELAEGVRAYDAKAAEYRRAQQLTRARRNMARLLVRRG